MAKNWWKIKNLDFFLIIDILPSAFPPSKIFAIIPIHVPLLKIFIDTLSKSPIWKFILHPCPYPPATETCKFHSWFLKIWKQNRKKFPSRIVLRTFGSPSTSPPKIFWTAPPHWKISMATYADISSRIETVFICWVHCTIFRGQDVEEQIYLVK